MDKFDSKKNTDKIELLEDTETYLGNIEKQLDVKKQFGILGEKILPDQVIGQDDELEQIIGNGVSDVTHGSVLLRMKEMLFSKPVPAMGGIGLLALGLSMLGLSFAIGRKLF